MIRRIILKLNNPRWIKQWIIGKQLKMKKEKEIIIKQKENPKNKIKEINLLIKTNQ